MTSPDAPTQPSSEPPRLNCYQGQPAPDQVVAGWRQLTAMHTSAQQAFTEMFTASMVHDDERQLEAVLDQFCQVNGVERPAAFSALKASQSLFTSAAALDLGMEPFIADLERLSGDEHSGLRLLASRYQALKEPIRQHLFEASLADHGKVLVGLDWRLDHVAASDRVAGLNSPVVYLTLRTRESDTIERTTIQLTSRSVHMLRAFCDRFSQGNA